MVTRRLSLILPLLALPSLLSCGEGSEPPGHPPPSHAALAAIGGDPGVSRDGLGRVIDDLFAPDAVGDTRALLVLRGGEIVAERYAPGFDKSTRMLGWSAAQCLTGIMIGQLVSDGRLRLDETAPVPAWQRSGDPRGEITLRQLLQMRSGLRHDEAAEASRESNTYHMLFLDGRSDMAAYAESQPLEAEPGRIFEFSNASALILSDLAARSLTSTSNPERRREAVSVYLRSRLLSPAGMDSAVPEFDAAGTFIGSSMVHATARDWAKLGEFLRHNGSVRGAQLVPHRWIEFMLRPSPRNPGFGALVWLNRPQPNEPEALFPAKAGVDAFGCIGEFGQYVIGSPRQKLTVVRLGQSTREQLPVLRERLGTLVALFPAG